MVEFEMRGQARIGAGFNIDYSLLNKWANLSIFLEFSLDFPSLAQLIFNVYFMLSKIK